MFPHRIAHRCKHLPLQMSLTPTWGEKIQESWSPHSSLRNWGPEKSQSPLGKFSLIFECSLLSSNVACKMPARCFLNNLMSARCFLNNSNSHFLIITFLHICFNGIAIDLTQFHCLPSHCPLSPRSLALLPQSFWVKRRVVMKALKL